MVIGKFRGPKQNQKIVPRLLCRYPTLSAQIKADSTPTELGMLIFLQNCRVH